MRLVVWATPPQYVTLLHLRRDPDYDMYNCVNLCNFILLSCVNLTWQPDSLEFSSTQRYTYFRTKNIQSKICEQLRAIERTLTRIRACEQLRIFCEHEQASTRLSLASKSSKGQILRALENFKGPFDTPTFCARDRLAGTKDFFIAFPTLSVCGKFCNSNKFFNINFVTLSYTARMKKVIKAFLWSGALPPSPPPSKIKKLANANKK